MIESSVPHLTTALQGPLLALEESFLANQTEIEAWFRDKWQNHRPPLTSSIDLRNAGFKLAPVDTNIFPAGFNNLAPSLEPLCTQAMQAVLSQNFPGCRRVLLLPESHTRNPFYLKSLSRLQQFIANAGYDVRIATLLPEINQPKAITVDEQCSITLWPLFRDGARLKADDFDPCMIVLNNDLSGEVPTILKGIEQPISPPIEIGWANRFKSTHFKYYQLLAEEFAAMLGLDPWLINPVFSYCGEVDFIKREGEECLIYHANQVLDKIHKKYQEYAIDKKPFVVVKADSGTYGMGIMMVHNANELKELNRKQRTKMSATKGSQKVTQVIIQEGVYTNETFGEKNAVAEPVVYCLGQHVVGGFYRLHQSKAHDENLNAPGMEFEPLAFAKSCNLPNAGLSPDDGPNRFYAYGVIARLASLAAALELERIVNDR